MNALANIFGLSPFMPHGACYHWRPDILLLQVGSDLLIALAYFSIPAALIVFLQRRPDIPFSWIFRLFIAFILPCGITHLFSIVVVWYPAYGIEGLLKLMTAVVSAVTAVALWPLIPKGVALPSPRLLQARNEEIAALNTRLKERIESLGTLAGGVAHDFNNLLAVIRGNAELLESSLESQSHSESLDAIINAADRATKFVGRGLGLSAVQGIVRGHEGCVFIDSAHGWGTTISIAFPVAKPVLHAQSYEEGSNLSSS